MQETLKQVEDTPSCDNKGLPEKQIRTVIFDMYCHSQMHQLVKYENKLLLNFGARHQPPGEPAVIIIYPDRRFLEIIVTYPLKYMT
jgi:hypothetical protein